MSIVRGFLGIATAGVLIAAFIALVFLPSKAGGVSALAVTSPGRPAGSKTIAGQPDAKLQASQPATTTADPPNTGDPFGSGPLRTHGGNIVDAAGRVVHISGVNWFGLETDTFAPHGLWARSLNDMLDQIAQAGFNTIRLPYSNDLLKPSNKPNGIDFQKNPDLQGLSGLQIMDQVIQRAGERGLKVILDRHRPTAAGQAELWYTGSVPEQAWIDDWVALASRYRGNPTVIGADLDNEPHGAATWGDGNPSTDWRAAAEKAGNAVLKANPDWLIFVEGIDHQGNDWYWWGGDLTMAGQFPVHLSAPDKLVYEAHDYGPGVNLQKWFQTPDFPQNLAGIWHSHWGYLKLDGIAPVLIGEFGGRSVGTDAEGIWQRTLVTYLQSNSFDYTYWCWNPNSGDTGGILQDDWSTPNQAKLSLLQAYQWPRLGAPVPAAAAAATVAAYAGPTAAAPASVPPSSPPPTTPSSTYAIGGPYDPDPNHVVHGDGGPNDPDPAHRQARQADEQRYLKETGKPWDRAIYITVAP